MVSTLADVAVVVFSVLFFYSVGWIYVVRKLLQDYGGAGALQSGDVKFFSRPSSERPSKGRSND